MNELVTKSVSKGKWLLEYGQYIDDFGLRQDGYTFKETLEDGMQKHYPAVAPFRVQNYSEGTPIDLCNEPTEEEMSKDLQDFINNLENYL